MSQMSPSHFTLFALLLSINLVEPSFGIDSLVPIRSISIGQALISRNQDFEMGFFSPGKSPNTYLGIWFKNTPDVVIWVANRNHPIFDAQGVTFAISATGALVISRGGNIIWSTNQSVAASNPVLKLLDTGNLVLVNETMEGSSQSYIWQSFDYPTDTWLPGMKLVDDIDAGMKIYLRSWRNWDDPSPGDFVFRIENEGLPDLVAYKGEKKIYRTGKWNGLYFIRIARHPNPPYKLGFVSKPERLIYIMAPYEGSAVTRLDSSGTLQRYTMNARKDRWNLVSTFPVDQCDRYSLCGPNSVCRIEVLESCECLKGFAPKFQNDWDVQDWSSGCTRITPLNCGRGDGFLEVRKVKFPDMLSYWLNTSMSLEECQAECLKNCNCTACANAYVTNGGHGCILWFGDLVDIRHRSSEDSKQNIYIRVPTAELELVNHPDIDMQEEKKKRPTKLILVSIASGVIISGFVNGGIFMITRRKKQAMESSNDDLELPLFKFAAIVTATNNFSSENLIGEGGFGPVYKGVLSSEEEIAIKRLSSSSGQGLEEFKNEVILIAKLQHTNLVRLLGCCTEGEERMLIYEYLHNKSLDYFVFDQHKRKLLTWPIRFDIVMGIARGLLYLHRDSRLKIIHRDIKTSNILLDRNFHPKISDFGLARTFGEYQPLVRTRRVVGTYGYMAPEYAIAGNYSVKSDIFSLGVVLLEIVSGKKNRGFEFKGDHYHSLLAHAWLLLKEKKAVELMDECLKDTFVESEVKRCIHVGLLCVQKNGEDRPEMSSVVSMLGSEGAILPDPKEPGFFVGASSSPKRSCTSPILMSGRNTITITDFEAR